METNEAPTVDRAGQASISVPVLVGSVVLLLAFALVMITSRAGASPGSTVLVSGEGVHFFTTAIVHSQEETATGMIQLSSDIVTLSGDLEGHILYHPTSIFDFAAGTLVNTGTQIFSGTILGSEPVILHDDRFRFEVDLATGATTGAVHLGRSNDSPHQGHWYVCDLEITGTGLTPQGDATFAYSGTCARMGHP
jgi:hypothetical protein